ncbi:MAG: tetratricopeptide repeat protein [candidate division NC10 bacterium]|nr:tetratricopeptide repeat protein [candidate division NC10 bacterium]
MTTPRLLSLVLGLLVTAHLSLLGFFQISDPDTWWHLKQGELYLTTWSLPADDPFAFTTAGREWVKFSWVADILFYLTFLAAGAPGLVLLRLLLLFLIALVLYRVLRGCDLHPLASVLLVFVASLALRFRLFVRPETLSFLLLLTTMAILLRLQDRPAREVYALLPVQVAWVNVHASFVFGFGLPGLVLLANLLPGAGFAPGWGRLRLDREHVRHLAAAVISLPAASLLNPHGASMLSFPFRQNTMTRLTDFKEWSEVWVLPEIDPVWSEVIIVLSVVLIAFATTAFLLLAWERRFDPVGGGIVLFMGTYAVFRSRALPYFVLAVLPLLALALVRVAGHMPARGPERPHQWLERTGAVACLLVLTASIVDQGLLTSRFRPGFGVRPNYFPEGATTFLERYRLNGRVFNSYKFGGYLLWRRWPANQVIIDGRYDAVLFDEKLLEAYLQAHRSPPALDRITAAYGVEILVLDADPDRRMAYLSRHPGWARVYWDPVAEVFVRRGGRHADLIADHEYRLTDPTADLRYLAAYRRDPDTWDRALTELRRAVADNPGNELAWLGLAQEYRAAGPTALEHRLEALARALALLPRAPVTSGLHAERAEALLQLGRFDEATVAAEEALRLDGELLSPRWVLASAAERRGAWAEARDQLRTILARLGPDHPETHIIRGRLESVERNLRTDGRR